ncbi:MAG TPA: hypothetical protein DCZ63_09005 [Geobacter sp.]|nr:hypothetical protein [Geobacter sp.]
MKKAPTAAQKRRMARVVDLGCIICGRPAAIHHCRHACGMSQRRHDHIAGLCGDHHQHGPISRHGQGAKEFKEKYGDDRWLHEETCRRLGELVEE